VKWLRLAMVPVLVLILLALFWIPAALVQAFVPPPTIITVTSPNGGETYTSGATEGILWTSTLGVGAVTIDLSRDGGNTWKTIIPVTANDGAEPWAVFVPATTDRARIRVSYCADWPRMGDDTSDADFTITRP